MKLRPVAPNRAPEELPIDTVLRISLLAFAEKSFYTMYPGSEFEPNWHHQHIEHLLMKSTSDPAFSRLLFNMPPRSFKSELINVVFTAWLLGHNPACQIISVSYGESHLIHVSRLVRKIMQSPWYRRIFPNTQLSRDKRTEIELETTKGGRRYATTMRGESIGHGADYLIIDDPNPSGPNFTEKVAADAVRIYKEKLVTRLNKQGVGVVIVLMQRVSPRDLTGYLLTSGLYVHSKLPLIAEADEDVPIGPNRFHHRKKGELLQPSRLGPAGLESLKAETSPAEFQLMWQQDASSSGLNAINLDHFTRYRNLLAYERYEKVLQVWDCASTISEDSSYTVCVTLGVYKDRLHVLDVYRDKVDYPHMLRAAKKLVRRLSVVKTFRTEAGVI